MSIDIVGGVSKVYEVIGPTLFRVCGYAIFYERHASNLKGEIKKLKNASTRLQHRVDHAESVRDIIEDDVWTWLRKANELIVSGSRILQENNIVCFGFVPNPKTRYILGRRATKYLPILKEHLDEGKFDEVSFQPVVEQNMEVKVRSQTSSSTARYVELKSRALVLKKIIVALEDHKKIGVYGMGGVGKTTLLKEVEKIAKESGKFDDVINAFVSQAPDIEGIKGKILNKLKRLDSNEDDASKKTLLILLDDLWEEFKGIGELDNSTKVKVKWVMTSRKQALLVKEMSCHPTISLGVLDEEEGWHLFEELVMSSNNIEDLKGNPATVELLKKCAGLPVSIEALAAIWKKNVLSSSDLVTVEELKLDNESEHGPLDLFGSNTTDKIMDRARREVTKSVCTLQDSSLLLESDDNNHVKIHDLVRDVAVRIACREDQALIFNPEEGVKGWSMAKMKDSTAVSLPYSALPMIFKEWKCPNARIFIMRVASEKGDHVKLEDSFFEGMVKLKIIDFRNARLTSLPSSIQSDLHNLTTLCLDYCYLENVAAIGKLESLQVLSFVGSEISELPEEIGGLSNLRMLDLSKCLKLESIKSGVLGRLTRLEELFLKESFDRWEIEEDGRQQTNSNLAELNNMVQLSTLEIRVRDDCELPPTLPLGDLVQYKVLMGDVWDWSSEYKESRTLKLKVQWDNIMTEDWLQSALQKIQDFHLDGLSGMKESFHEVCWEGFKELKHLHLQNCSSFKSIVWSVDWWSCGAFTTLESMLLENLESLEGICTGLISHASFSKLNVVRVKVCHKLRNLFNISFLRSLPELEEIEVSDCNMVREIFISEKIGDDVDVDEGSPNYYEFKLDKLHNLTLRNLPKLTSFFTNEAQNNDPLYIPQPVFFNYQQILLQNSHKLSSDSKFKEISSSVHFTPNAGNLRRVVLENCNNIVNFTDSSMLLKLGNLESLTIERCESLESIFDLGGIDSKSRNVEILPKLSELKLRGLPKLVHIWKNNVKQMKGCRNLRILEIYQCGNLAYLSGSSMCKVMENLTEINIMQCDIMKTVFMEEDGPTTKVSTMIWLTSLKIIEISKCPNLETFVSSNCDTTSNHVRSCHNIDYSKAIKCVDNGLSCWYSQKKDSISRDTSISFFSNKVSLPSLESLFLSSSGKFDKLWCNDQLPTDKSYSNLEVIKVEFCDTLSVVFPATLIEILQKLKQLSIQNCKKLSTIFNFDVGWEDKKIPKTLILSQLQKLTLIDLENMTYVLEQGHSDILVAFPNLKEFKVESCHKLRYLIPADTATTLLKLESLDISSCGDMWAVINGKVSDGYKRNGINFPRLTFLRMNDLQSLTLFSSESYSFDFTYLRRIQIWDCEHLETLVKPTSSGHDSGSQPTTDFQTLFTNKVDLPNLEELDIRSINVEELWCTEPLTSSFYKLKSLEVRNCCRLRIIIPSFIVKRLQNLKAMDIRGCQLLDDIFETPSKPKKIILQKLTSLTVGEDIKLSMLQLGRYTLELPSLNKLLLVRTIGGTVETILEKVYLPNLEDLQVYSADNITRLWHREPHAGSFCKLRHLQVEQCGQLIIIIPSFMLERMQNIEKLKVHKCNQLQTVAEMGVLIDAQESESKLPPSPFVNLSFIQVESCECLLSLFTISNRPAEYADTSEYCVLRHLTKLRLRGLPNFSCLFQIQGQYSLKLKLSSLEEFFLIYSGAKEAIAQKVTFPKDLKIREHDITFFGSTTTVAIDIMEALHQNEQTRQITGARGEMDYFVKRELERLLKEEKQLFDEVVDCRGLSNFHIQEELRRVLGIVYGTTGDPGRAQRLRKSLLSNREKRLLLITKETDEAKSSGVVWEELEPKWFKQIAVSKNKEALMEMGARVVVEIGCNVGERRHIFTEMEDSKQKQPQADTNMDMETSPFVGSSTVVMNHITSALLDSNNQVIGLFGKEGIRYYRPLFIQLARLAKKEANLFKDIVDLEGHNLDENDIYSQLIRSRSDISYNDTVAGFHEKAQHLRDRLLSSRLNGLLLIILRGFDQALDLEVIGVPPTSFRPQFFKMVIFSKSREVLHTMGAEYVIDITSLSLDDLDYCRIKDGYVEKSDLRKLADECGCDDLAELLVKKLKGQGVLAWANAFQRLKESPFEYEARKEVITSLDSKVMHMVTFPKDLKIREHDITFFGSTTTVAIDIMEALHQNEQTRQITGARGEMDYFVKRELERLLKEEKLFDEVVDCRGLSNFDIQQELGRVLGIVYGTTGDRGRAQRLRKSLLSNREKRFLLITKETDEAKSAGVVWEELEPKWFKQIVVSKNKEALMEMGARVVVEIGCNVGERRHIFTEMEDSKQKQPQADTNMDKETSSFVGSSAIVMDKITSALLYSDDQVIGLLGTESIRYYRRLFIQLARLAKKEANLFDYIVDLEGYNMDENYIYLQLIDSRSDISYNDTVAGFHEKAQHLRDRLLSSRENRLLLIILRGFDHALDLEVIGIPPTSSRPNFFKMVIFSKSREVLHTMGAQQVIDITSISLDDLDYCRIKDGYVEKSDLRKLADECGCDDLAELLVKKLKGQGVRAWANAFQRLMELPFEYEARKEVITSLDS